jgi:hypothetical protein
LGRRGHACPEGARKAPAPDGAVEARGILVDVRTPPPEAALTVEDRVTALGQGEAQELSLRDPLPAARTTADRLRQDSSASPVGSADSGAGSRAGSSAVTGAASASSTASTSVSTATTSSTSSSSPSSPVSTVTSSVS